MSKAACPNPFSISSVNAGKSQHRYSQFDSTQDLEASNRFIRTTCLIRDN